MREHYDGYIGVFDSGVGGISVLKDLVELLPHENFLFYGDSRHAPYGEKTIEEVNNLASNVANYLVSCGVKAIVIACNTATSTTANQLRASYGIPVVGVEPALKPAAIAEKHGRVLVMATPITLELDKFQQLARKYSRHTEVVPVPCPGLAERIEHGNLDADDLHELLEGFLGQYKGEVDGVVLGCTHYVFIKEQIRRVLGDVPLFDGGKGTARELERQLKGKGLLSENTEPGTVVFRSSEDAPEELALYEQFFNMEI